MQLPHDMFSMVAYHLEVCLKSIPLQIGEPAHSQQAMDLMVMFVMCMFVHEHGRQYMSIANS